MVRNPAGRPVADAFILAASEQPSFDRRQENGTWLPGPPPQELHSDLRGAFSAESLEPGECAIQVRAPGFAPWVGKIEIISGQDSRLLVMLEQGASVQGTVRDQRGLAVPYALVRAGGQGLFASTTTYSSGDGRYVLEGLPSAQVDLFAEHHQNGRARKKLFLTASRQGHWDPVLSNDDPDEYLFAGHLLDHRGQPLAGWRVVAAEVGSMTRSVSGGTDSSGGFRIRIPWQDLRVWAHAPRAWDEFPNMIVEGLHLDGSQVQLTVPDPLLSSGRIEGKIVDQAGRPLLAKLQIWHSQKRMWRTIMNDGQSGKILVENVPPGDCSLEVRSNGHPWKKLGE